MRDLIAAHVCTTVAIIWNTPEPVRPETMLTLGHDLGNGLHPSAAWRKLCAIATVLEDTYRIKFEEFAVEGWATVADIICATEKAIEARPKPKRAA